MDLNQPKNEADTSKEKTKGHGKCAFVSFCYVRRTEEVPTASTDRTFALI